MNVLVVHNYYLEPGGEDQVFADEQKLLADRGHVVGRFTMHNQAIAGMGRLELACKTLWNKEAQIPLRQAIREIRADVVHFHNTFPLISPAAYYTAHEQGAGVVQTLHNYRLVCPSATLYRDERICEDCLGRLPWPGVIHRCYHDSVAASSMVAAMLAYHRIKGTWWNEVDVYIALSEFARRKFIAGGLPAERIIVKPNFVWPDPGVGQGEGGFALSVGRLIGGKGIMTLLKGWETLSQHNPLVLKIIGDGPLRREVEDASRRIPTIHYEGRRTPAEVYAMMGAARVLVFASHWYEGLPRTIIESFAKGTPVLASDTGSMVELVAAGRTGAHFAVKDPEDLALQAERLMTDERKLAWMRQQARLEFESGYTAERNYPMLLEAYGQAMAGRRPGQRVGTE